MSILKSNELFDILFMMQISIGFDSGNDLVIHDSSNNFDP